MRVMNVITAMLAMAIAGCLFTGCAAPSTAAGPSPGPRPTSAVPTTSSTLKEATGADTGGGIVTLPARCTAGPAPTPDPTCTTGSIDPTVTTTDLCPTARTKTRRPPTSYTEPLKRDLMARYGVSGPMSNYELDHLVPLELGGSGWSVWNLWPERNDHPRPGVLNSKDEVENAAHLAVCSGKVTLSDAQVRIATGWVGFGRQLGVAVSA